jgi:hypothetical protein
MIPNVAEWVYSLVQWLGYANSMLNPMIYGVLHRNILTSLPPLPQSILSLDFSKVNFDFK